MIPENCFKSFSRILPGIPPQFLQEFLENYCSTCSVITARLSQKFLEEFVKNFSRLSRVFQQELLEILVTLPRHKKIAGVNRGFQEKFPGHCYATVVLGNSSGSPPAVPRDFLRKFFGNSSINFPKKSCSSPSEISLRVPREFLLQFSKNFSNYSLDISPVVFPRFHPRVSHECVQEFNGKPSSSSPE